MKFSVPAFRPLLAAAAVAVAAAPASAQSDAAAPRLAPLQQRYLNAATDRVRNAMTEEAAEQAARNWAKARGWEVVERGGSNAYRPGYDQVFVKPDGTVVVAEVKGTRPGRTPRLKTAGGFTQGTPEYNVFAAEQRLKSPATTAWEKSTGKQVLRAAGRGRLESLVLHADVDRGLHVGKLTDTARPMTGAAKRMSWDALMRVDRGGASTIVPDYAERTGRRGAATGRAANRSTAAPAAPKPAAKPVPRAAGRVSASAGRSTRAAGRSAGTAGRSASALTRGAARVAGPAAVVYDGVVRAGDARETEARFRRGEIDQRQREASHSRNAGGFVGGTAGAAGGAEAGAVAVAAVGTAICPGVGTLAGGLIGGGAGAIGGYYGGAAVGEAMADASVRALHSSGRTLKGAGRAVGRTFSSGWRYATDW